MKKYLIQILSFLKRKFIDKLMEDEPDASGVLLVKIEFLKSPTGTYNLGYSKGDKAKVNAVIASKMVADGTAKKVK